MTQQEFFLMWLQDTAINLGLIYGGVAVSALIALWAYNKI